MSWGARRELPPLQGSCQRAREGRTAYWMSEMTPTLTAEAIQRSVAARQSSFYRCSFSLLMVCPVDASWADSQCGHRPASLRAGEPAHPALLSEAHSAIWAIGRWPLGQPASRRSQARLYTRAIQARLAPARARAPGKPAAAAQSTGRVAAGDRQPGSVSRKAVAA